MHCFLMYQTLKLNSRKSENKDKQNLVELAPVQEEN